LFNLSVTGVGAITEGVRVNTSLFAVDEGTSIVNPVIPVCEAITLAFTTKPAGTLHAAVKKGELVQYSSTTDPIDAFVIVLNLNLCVVTALDNEESIVIDLLLNSAALTFMFSKTDNTKTSTVVKSSARFLFNNWCIFT
jgi:hypothetical protein